MDRSPAFVCLGDIHLDPVIWRRYRQILGDSFVGFEGFVDTALSLNVPLVILGDLFDTVEPTPELVQFFRGQMDRCVSAQIPVYAIQGNHDKRRTPWYTAIHSHPVHIGHGAVVNIGDFTVVGFDYAPLAEIREHLAGLEGTTLPQVLFLHQAVKQAIAIDGAWNCDLEWVPEGIPLIVMGDIHSQTEYTVREGQRAYYTGSSHPRSISEIGPKSCVIVHKDLSVTRSPIPYRRIRKFIVSDAAEIPSLEAWLEEAISESPSRLIPVAWVHHTIEASPDCMALSARYDGRAMVVLEAARVGISVEEMGEQELTVESLVSCEALIAKMVSPEKEPEIYSFVLDLVKSKDIPETILSMKQVFYGDNKER